MKAVLTFSAVAVAVALSTSIAPAQDIPKPGPEHEILKKREGTWDLTMQFGGMETKGTVVNKMEVGGMWLVSNLESDLFGQKFYGKGLDSFDPTTKKYIGVWIDSMGSRPMTLEGTYDKATKTMTLSGDGPGMDGQPTKYKSVSTMPDDNTINFSMYVGDGKDPAFTIVYKRRK